MATIGAEYNAVNILIMSKQLNDLVARLCIPQDDRMIAAGCGNICVIGTKGHIRQFPGMSFQNMESFPCAHIPDDRGAIYACSHDPCATWIEYNAGHQVAMPGKNVQGLTGLCIPNPGYVSCTSRCSQLTIGAERACPNPLFPVKNDQWLLCFCIPNDALSPSVGGNNPGSILTKTRIRDDI